MRSTSIGIGAALVVGLIMGGVIGRFTAPSPSATPSPRRPLSPSMASNPTQASAPSRPLATGDCADIEAELVEERAYRESLEFELYGTPIPWPDDTPHQDTEEGFSEIIEAVVEDCEPGWLVHGYDCTEPPCMAVIFPEEGTNLSVGKCPAWVEPFGNAASNASMSIKCADGEEKRLLLLSPPPVQVQSRDTKNLDVDYNSPDWQNRMKRLKARWERLKQDTPCP